MVPKSLIILYHNQTDSSTHHRDVNLKSDSPGPEDDNEMTTRTWDSGEENALQASNDESESKDVAYERLENISAQEE